MKCCEKSPDVIKNCSRRKCFKQVYDFLQTKSYGMAKFHAKFLLARCTNLASVSNYSMVVGLKDMMTGRTNTAIF